MQLSMNEILLWDLVQTDPSKKLRFLRERALFGLKSLSEGFGDPQDFGYDAEKWKEWLLIHSDGFKEWMDYQEQLSERIRRNKKSSSEEE
jgi:hypothetical protein